MPWPFRKKKKKKELPEPPSFSKEYDSPISGPPRESLSPPTRDPPIYEGPPRKSPTKEVIGPPNLPPPPPIAGKTPSQPPLSSEQSIKTPTPRFDDGTIAGEIHAELRQKDFGSAMKKTPERKAVTVSTEELAKRHFRDAKQENIEAGNKHLELNFYDNAAISYACAILCDLVGEGWQTAHRTMSKLSSGMPSAVLENSIFDGVRLIIEAIRTKNYTFLTRAERTLQKNTEHLYPEDIAIIEKGLKTARAYFGL